MASASAKPNDVAAQPGADATSTSTWHTMFVASARPNDIDAYANTLAVHLVEFGRNRLLAISSAGTLEG
ncbi:hypothetical protein FRX31_022704 [Thalictrum thalictroides]|uniref:Uncharacterized protein n=1 Tax=Thalictrum thalictroides TaxID=46969 RepID=A0A7J6VRK1_THATH|nr:hypothetical protein FRX31_022704 [Thalictrum thalictroides]